jgi:hypothetical protein
MHHGAAPRAAVSPQLISDIFIPSLKRSIERPGMLVIRRHPQNAGELDGRSSVNGPINKEAQDGYRHWPWKPQGRCAQTFTAANQNDGTEALDQAQPSKRRIHVTKEARHQEIQRRPTRAGLTRQLSDGKVSRQETSKSFPSTKSRPTSHPTLRKKGGRSRAQRPLRWGPTALIATAAMFRLSCDRKPTAPAGG